MTIAVDGNVVGPCLKSTPVVEAKLSGECLGAPDQGAERGGDREFGGVAIVGGDVNVDVPLEPAVGPNIGLEPSALSPVQRVCLDAKKGEVVNLWLADEG